MRDAYRKFSENKARAHVIFICGDVPQEHVNF